MEILKEDMAVVEAAAREKMGYSLDAVRVEPGRLVACNGKILLTREIVVEEEEDPFEAFLLEARAFKAAVGKGGFLRPGENGASASAPQCCKTARLPYLMRLLPRQVLPGGYLIYSFQLSTQFATTSD